MCLSNWTTVLAGSGEAVAHFSKSLQSELAGSGSELKLSKCGVVPPAGACHQWAPKFSTSWRFMDYGATGGCSARGGTINGFRFSTAGDTRPSRRARRTSQVSHIVGHGACALLRPARYRLLTTTQFGERIMFDGDNLTLVLAVGSNDTAARSSADHGVRPQCGRVLLRDPRVWEGARPAMPAAGGGERHVWGAKPSSNRQKRPAPHVQGATRATSREAAGVKWPRRRG